MSHVLTSSLHHVSAHLFRSVPAWQSLHSVPLQPTLGFLLGVRLKQRATRTVGEGSRISAQSLPRHWADDYSITDHRYV